MNDTKKVRALIARGLSSKEINSRLRISISTVKYHTKKLFIQAGLFGAGDQRLRVAGRNLPTQSRYAFTTTGALNFAVIGNLVFSPTFTTFCKKS
jgi:hypothetical protein